PFGSADAQNEWHRLAATTRNEINEHFATIGKALAAYQATLNFEPNAVDQMIASKETSTLSESELAGLKLFLDAGKTQCLRCHNGPLYSNGGFHNVGTGTGPSGEEDFGRMLGLQAVWYDPFRCDGSFSDAGPEDCHHLQFVPRTQMPMNLTGAFKVPTLRNVAATAPYFHDGRFNTLDEVMAFYLDPPEQTESGHELPPLDLTEEEVAQIIAFLKVL
ncbi:MAG: cytochrome-c peroxidase, partial [Pseudomonadota bacterium]